MVRRSQNFYIGFFLVLTIFTGGLFFTGGDLLLVIFAMTLAGIFFVLAGYKASSPYSFIGAQRELLQMMSYEPAVILSAAAGRPLPASAESAAAASALTAALPSAARESREVASAPASV